MEKSGRCRDDFAWILGSCGGHGAVNGLLVASKHLARGNQAQRRISVALNNMVDVGSTSSRMLRRAVLSDRVATRRPDWRKE